MLSNFVFNRLWLNMFYVRVGVDFFLQLWHFNILWFVDKLRERKEMRKTEKNFKLLKLIAVAVALSLYLLYLFCVMSHAFTAYLIVRL